MLSKLVTAKNSFFKDILEESKILLAYRFISLLITSSFYVLNQPDHELIRKVAIIGCLSLSAFILSYLYSTYEESHTSIKLLLIIETIGNTILVIPSGGIKSPFIWYSLNTILISSIFLKRRYCWINLMIYFLGYGIIIGLMNKTNINILEIIRNESNLILSYIMIIASIQVWTIYIERTKNESARLQESNIQLESANKIITDSMDHIKELYQSVNILANQGNRDGIIRIAFEHIKRITKTNMVFYYDISNNMNKIISTENKHLLKAIEEHILESMDETLKSDIPVEIYIQDRSFLIITVASSYATYGILGFESNNSQEAIIHKENVFQLKFISELISTAFEGLTLEEVKDRLLITEEQNRIANEIHDSVLQRLFSMSCSMFSLIKKLDSYSTDEIINELNLFRETTDSTMKELRNKIYGLSWKKSGHSSFSKDIKSYIDEISNLNQVNIPFSILGNLEILSTNHKKALYRIICEGVGNAVRHGKAKNIEVILDVSAENTNLSVIDDGIGFDVEKVKEDSIRGIGIKNFYQITEEFLGEISIDSVIDKGTKIEVVLPNVVLKGEAAI